MAKKEGVQQKILGVMEKYPFELKELDIFELRPNSWNPNRQSAAVAASVKKSIEQYGLLQFPVVKAYLGQYQIIDGEHKWKACKELGYTKIRCLVLGTIDNEVAVEDAMLLTELLNTRGEDDPIEQAKLLKELKKRNPKQMSLLPFSEKEVEAKTKLTDWSPDMYDDANKVAKLNRTRTLGFALTEEEYDYVKNALSLTKKDQNSALMIIVREYVALREDIADWEQRKANEPEIRGVKPDSIIIDEVVPVKEEPKKVLTEQERIDQMEEPEL